MQEFDLKVKKRPKQARSMATFEALVEACTLLLPKYGYARTTTNHIAEAAGVGISSLYEYFPSKDAVIAEAIKVWNARLINELAASALAIGNQNLEREQLMPAWLNAIYYCLENEKDIIRVFTYEVPYSEEISQQQGIGQQLLLFSEFLETGAKDVLPNKQSKESMYLIVTIVVTTLTNLAINPPQDLEKEKVIEELANKLNLWIFS